MNVAWKQHFWIESMIFVFIKCGINKEINWAMYVIRVSLKCSIQMERARCSSVVRAFAHGAMGPRIDPSWWTH